jgi:hypothetical protein
MLVLSLVVAPESCLAARACTWFCRFIPAGRFGARRVHLEGRLWRFSPQPHARAVHQLSVFAGRRDGVPALGLRQTTIMAQRFRQKLPHDLRRGERRTLFGGAGRKVGPADQNEPPVLKSPSPKVPPVPKLSGGGIGNPPPNPESHGLGP